MSGEGGDEKDDAPSSPSVTSLSDQAPVSDADAIAAFRAGLEAWCNGDGRVDPTRENVQRLIELTLTALGPAFQWRVDMGDITARGEHWAFDLFRAVGHAMSDLDRGSTPELVRAQRGGTGSRLWTEEKIRDEGLLELIEVVRLGKLHASHSTPEEYVANLLNAAGSKRRGKSYSAPVLRNLRGNIKQRKGLP